MINQKRLFTIDLTTGVFFFPGTNFLAVASMYGMKLAIVGINTYSCYVSFGRDSKLISSRNFLFTGTLTLEPSRDSRLRAFSILANRSFSTVTTILPLNSKLQYLLVQVVSQERSELDATKLLVIQFLKPLIESQSRLFSTLSYIDSYYIFKLSICEAAWQSYQNNALQKRILQ